MSIKWGRGPMVCEWLAELRKCAARSNSSGIIIFILLHARVKKSVAPRACTNGWQDCGSTKYGTIRKASFDPSIIPYLCPLFQKNQKNPQFRQIFDFCRYCGFFLTGLFYFPVFSNGSDHINNIFWHIRWWNNMHWIQ